MARILPDDQLAAHVEAVAGTLGAGPRRALELTRRALAASTLGHLDHALERERAGQIELIGTPDFAEGADADTVRLRLLDEHGVGTIALGEANLRVAFSCLTEAQIPLVFEAIAAAVADQTR